MPRDPEVRELHGRERAAALAEHFGWRQSRREELRELLAELAEREAAATTPMPFDPVANSRPAPRWVPPWRVE